MMPPIPRTVDKAIPKHPFALTHSIGLGAVHALPQPGICSCMCCQSPTAIWLDKAKPFPADYRIELKTGEMPVAMSVEQDTVFVKPPEHADNSLTLSSDHFNQTFAFKQMHFHTGAEHWMHRPGEAPQAERQAAEAHMVFESPDHRLAVVGVIFHISDKHNPAIEKILQNQGDINLSELLPPDRKIAYLPGSLTTSPFTHGVHWMVAETEQGISAKQLERLKFLMNNIDNARNLQDPGDPNLRPIHRGQIMLAASGQVIKH